MFFISYTYYSAFLNKHWMNEDHISYIKKRLISKGSNLYLVVYAGRFYALLVKTSKQVTHN